MDKKANVERLNRRGIRSTAIRILVLKSMLEVDRAVSLLDLENLLDTVDKSTLFRTINLFASHRLIHSIDDGSGSLKYAVCSDDCLCEVDDLHAHFYCEACQKTFCLINTPIPTVTLPDGFTLESANYVLKGLCPACAEKERKRRN